MILFTILVLIVIALVVFGAVALAVCGAGALIIFGDAIVCIAILVWIILKITNHERKD